MKQDLRSDIKTLEYHLNKSNDEDVRMALFKLREFLKKTLGGMDGRK